MKNLPLIVQNKLENFSEQERNAFFQEYNKRKKSVGKGYLALLILGWHYGYVGKWGLQALCILTVWGFFFWWFIDWFRLPSLIKGYNRKMSIDLVHQVR